MRFSKKIVIITGAGSGLGQGISVTFAQEKAVTVLIGRTKKKLDQTVKKIKEIDGSTEAYICDVTQKKDIEKVVASVIKKYGKIDILINCAGQNFIKDIFSISESEWNNVLDSNLTSAFLFSQSVSKYMKRQKNGKIINISSIHAFATYPLRSVYTASKTGLIGLTRSLALELAPFGINVNCLAPGQILTDKVKEIVKSGKLNLNKVKEKTPMGRIATTEDIIGPLLFLASKEADFIQGQTLIVDGGYLINATP